MAIPTLDGFESGEIVSAYKLTQHTKTAVEKSVYFKPVCRIKQSAGQLLVSGSLTIATLNVAIEDTDSMADTGNNRIVIKTAGLYRVTFNSAFASNATGYRHGEVRKNGAGILADSRPAVNGFVTRLCASEVIRFAVNEQLYLHLQHTVGAPLNTDVGLSGVALSAEWVSL